MQHRPDDLLRRTLLKSAAAGLAVGVAGNAVAKAKKEKRANPTDPTSADAAKPAVLGKPGDFDFLTGEWKIHHRQLKANSETEWNEFEGEATCWSILGGVAHVEELRIPARNFSGMGLRLLDLEKKIWSDYWVNAKSGVLGAAGLTGVFIDGVGTFLADDKEGDKPVKYRGMWDRITPNSHRWYQGVSYDGGNTWKDSWFMDWVRVR